MVHDSTLPARAAGLQRHTCCIKQCQIKFDGVNYRLHWLFQTRFSIKHWQMWVQMAGGLEACSPQGFVHARHKPTCAHHTPALFSRSLFELLHLPKSLLFWRQPCFPAGGTLLPRLHHAVGTADASRGSSSAGALDVSPPRPQLRHQFCLPEHPCAPKRR